MMVTLNIKRMISLFILLYFVLFLVRVPNIDAVNTLPYIRGAHRGNSAEYKENTIEAIQSALNESKYRFVEFDVQYTKDKKIVLFHDYTLMRMGGKLEWVGSLNYDELISDIGFHIPTYSEAMDMIGDAKHINIEIKPSKNHEMDKGLADFVVEDCRARGVLKNVVLSSLSSALIEYVSETYPEVKTGIIYFVHPVTYIQTEDIVNRFYGKTTSMGADYVLLHGVNLRNYELLARLKPEDTTLIFWYLDERIYVLDKNPVFSW